MKRLGENATNSKAIKTRRDRAIKNKDFIIATTNIYSDEEAVNSKMRQIHPKLFGAFCPVKYTLIEKERVYVPYLFLVFEYQLSRGAKKRGKNGAFDRNGKIGVVFDMNEEHAFHFDLVDELNFREQKSADAQAKILRSRCNEKEAVNQSIESVKRQYLGKVLYQVPEITLLEKTRFYREAIALQLDCKGKMFEKYAYKDGFGMMNEHVSGLKVRLTV